MAGGTVAPADSLVLVECGLPRVVVTYLVLNDEDHDRLSEEAGAPLPSGVAHLAALVATTALEPPTTPLDDRRPRGASGRRTSRTPSGRPLR